MTNTNVAKIDEIHNKVIAIDRKIETLLKERTYLVSLSKVYGDEIDTNTDSYQESMRDVARLRITKKPKKSRYYKYFDAVWSGNTKNQPLTLTTMSDKLNELEAKTSVNALWNIVTTAVNAGYMEKIERDHTKYYIWLGTGEN